MCQTTIFDGSLRKTKHLKFNHCADWIQIEFECNMDDLYSFGKIKYIPADPIQRSIFRYVANVLLVSYTVIKCTVLGILLALKALVLLVIPQSSKDIQHQVALVWFYRIRILKCTLIIFRFIVSIRSLEVQMVLVARFQLNWQNVGAMWPYVM